MLVHNIYIYINIHNITFNTSFINNNDGALYMYNRIIWGFNTRQNNGYKTKEAATCASMIVMTIAKKCFIQ